MLCHDMTYIYIYIYIWIYNKSITIYMSFMKQTKEFINVFFNIIFKFIRIICYSHNYYMYIAIYIDIYR